MDFAWCVRPDGIARQQWRARIETASGADIWFGPGGIARQQWRARIETAKPSSQKKPA